MLLNEYDFDSLSYIDREYDNPHVKNAVNELIQQEMKLFEPQDYLSHLPLPAFKHFDFDFHSRPEIAKEIVDPPSSSLNQDVQAWKRSVSNAKVQIVNQSNKIMNLELAEEHVAPQWLRSNAILEKLSSSYEDQTVKLNKSMHDIHMSRQVSQEKTLNELNKLISRRDNAIVRKLQCQQAFNQLNHVLTKKGFDIEKYKAEELAKSNIDVHSAEHNMTVRQYETINTSIDDTHSNKKRKTND